VPLIASVFIPGLKVAEMMVQGKVPGIVFPESLLNRMRQEQTAPDKGEEARLLRGAKMVALLKQMGYAGVHLGGNNLDFGKTAFLLDQADSFARSADLEELRREVDFPAPAAWYLYPESGRQLERPRTALAAPALYRINQQIHDSAFKPEGFLFPLARFISLRSDPHRQIRRLYTSCERLLKAILFRCRMCGDCTLAESNYLCPQSGCPKKMINGPCGGSLHGFCEVYPEERLCFWVRVHDRHPTSSPKTLSRRFPPLPPKDWAQQGSSSWLNYFTGRDHNKLGSKSSKP
jgi:methylenetetrahydrofolate reductase (NADPH)